MPGSTTTTFTAFMKTRYTKETVENLTQTDRELLALIPKDPNLSGEVFVEPIIISNPQGMGATRALAQTGANLTGTGANVVGKKWQLTFGDYAASVYIGEKVIRASKDDMGAFLRNQATECDALIDGVADHTASLLYGDTGHSLGTFTISTGVCTLTNADDIVNFQLGMQVTASANDGTSTGHSLLGSGSIGYIIAVDYNAGTFTVSATDNGAAGTPSGWTGTMYAFRSGDFGGGATPNVIFFGLGAWLTASAPSSTSFYGNDRTLSSWLQGVRLTSTELSGLGNEQRIKRLCTRIKGRFGGPGATHIFVNPEKWQSLADSMESRGTRPLDGTTGTISYKKLEVAMAGKSVEIIADRFCPIGTAWALSLKNWKMRSYGPVPDVLRTDGNEVLRLSSSDVYEFRLVMFPVVSTNAPSYSGRVPLL